MDRGLLLLPFSCLPVQSSYKAIFTTWLCEPRAVSQPYFPAFPLFTLGTPKKHDSGEEEKEKGHIVTLDTAVVTSDKGMERSSGLC